MYDFMALQYNIKCGSLDGTSLKHGIPQKALHKPLIIVDKIMMESPFSEVRYKSKGRKYVLYFLNRYIKL